MSQHQPGILCPVPPASVYLELTILPDTNVSGFVKQIWSLDIADQIVIGFGTSLLRRFETTIDGLRSFEDTRGANDLVVPGSQTDLFVECRGRTPAAAESIETEFLSLITGSFEIVRRQSAFLFAGGRDLTGYEDGTENPEGDDALEAAIVCGKGSEFDGASFVAIQKWQHDMTTFRSFDPDEQDLIIGRRVADNTEIDDAPDTAHVKRTAQEDFEPEAFSFRRSMAWSDESGEGLMLTSYSASLYPFDVQLNRMIGLDDGIVDALFCFSTPLTGAFYWCPPLADGKLDLSALG